MQISLLACGQNQSLSQVCMLIMDFWELKDACDAGGLSWFVNWGGY